MYRILLPAIILLGVTEGYSFEVVLAQNKVAKSVPSGFIVKEQKEDDVKIKSFEFYEVKRVAEDVNQEDADGKVGEADADKVNNANNPDNASNANNDEEDSGEEFECDSHTYLLTKKFLKDFRSSIVVLFFWNTWEPESLVELKKFDKFARAVNTLETDVKVYLIPLVIGDKEDYKKIVDIYDSYSLNNLDIFVADNKGIKDDYKIKSFPASFFIGVDGYELAKVNKAINWDSSFVMNFLKSISKEKRKSIKNPTNESNSG